MAHFQDSQPRGIRGGKACDKERRSDDKALICFSSIYEEFKHPSGQHPEVTRDRCRQRTYDATTYVYVTASPSPGETHAGYPARATSPDPGPAPTRPVPATATVPGPVPGIVPTTRATTAPVPGIVPDPAPPAAAGSGKVDAWTTPTAPKRRRATSERWRMTSEPRWRRRPVCPVKEGVKDVNPGRTDSEIRTSRSPILLSQCFAASK